MYCARAGLDLDLLTRDEVEDVEAPCGVLFHRLGEVQPVHCEEEVRETAELELGPARPLPDRPRLGNEVPADRVA